MQAIEFLEEAHHLQHPDSDTDVHNNLGIIIIMAMLGKLAEANGHFNEALRIHPDDPYTLNNLGLTYARQGDRGKAERFFKRMLEIDPEFCDTRENLIKILRKRQGSHS